MTVLSIPTRALAARERLGLSRAELATRAGLAFSTVWMLERCGDARPATLAKVAAVLGCEPDALRGLTVRIPRGARGIFYGIAR